jgi:hypothetical protein
MIAFYFRTSFFWLVFAMALGGKNWVFPYGMNGARLSVSNQRSAKLFRQNHLSLHPLQ